LDLSFVFASDDGSATIGVVVFVTEISTNQAKQQSNTLHIGTHILSESSKNNTQNPNQTHYQLTSHLQSNTMELDDKAQTLSYEHYYPYGGTAIIAGKDKTQVQQKRYRYTGKERDDSSNLSYYGARYLAPCSSQNDDLDVYF
jgi:hypothetical protein